MSYKFFFAVIVKRSYWVRHIDVRTDFFYGFMDAVIPGEQSHFFYTELDKVCKQMKALYSLKQALHVWHRIIVKFLKELRLIWRE